MKVAKISLQDRDGEAGGCGFAAAAATAGTRGSAVGA